MTKVRGAWAAFAIVFSFLTVNKLKKIGVVLLIILMLGIFLTQESTVTYIMALTSIKDRSVMWQNGWEIFKKHPIIGNGLNTFFVNYKEVRKDSFTGERGSYAHNCYLQMAADIGLFGLISFLVFVFLSIRRAFASLRRIKEPFYHSLILGISLGLLAYLLHSFVDTNLYSLNLAVLFWLSLGILLAAIKIADPEKS